MASKKKKSVPKKRASKSSHRSSWLYKFPIEKRQSEKEYIKNAIREIRKYVRGYDAKDGYGLSDAVNLHPSRLAKLRREIKQLRELRGSSTVPIRVSRSNKKAIRELQKRTSQKIKDQKVFFVSTGNPENVRGRIVKGRIQLETKAKGIVLIDRFFPLPRKPKSFKQIISMTKKMLKDMPRGSYMLEVKAHGMIGRPVSRDLIIPELLERWATYDRMVGHEGFSASVTGYRFISNTDVGTLKFMRERESFKLQYEKQKAENRREARRAARRGMTKRQRITGK